MNTSIDHPEKRLKPAYIYCFSYFNPILPSVRYRAVYPLDQLHREHRIDYCHVYPGYDRKAVVRFVRGYLSALFFRRKNSVILFQRIYTRGIYATLLKILLKFRNNRTFYDTDDAEHLLRTPVTINFFVKHSRYCIVGSNELKIWAEKLNPRVHLLTSPVYPHRKFKGSRGNPFTIGWIGCFGRDHKTALYDLCFPAIKKLEIPVKLVVLGVTSKADKSGIINYFKGRDKLILDVPLEVDWLDEDAVYESICAFDVGLAPLVDNAIHRSKSAFKLKQYFSCGVPGLSNRVGENALFLRDGENGVFCESVEDFTLAISRFYEMDKSEYEWFSRNARASVHTFTMANYCSEMVHILATKHSSAKKNGFSQA